MEFPGGIILSIKDDQVSVEAGKTTLKMSRDGDIDIESAAKVNMKATGDMSLSAANLKIESRGTLDVKATGTAKFEATGPLNIKGSMVNIN